MNVTDDLACRELVELLTGYLEGTLAPDVRSRIDRHLAGCDGCGSALEQLRETIRLTGRLSEDRLGPEYREALRGVFRGWQAEPAT
jgi:anti-sigma factor RsiW